MATYVEINGTRYPATIGGRMSDKDWDGRSSKYVRATMAYEEAKELFVDGVDWNIVQDVEKMVEREVEVETENGEKVMQLVSELVNDVEVYDNSEYSIVGDFIIHNDDTVTVKMGKPTAEELLAILMEA